MINHNTILWRRSNVATDLSKKAGGTRFGLQPRNHRQSSDNVNYKIILKHYCYGHIIIITITNHQTIFGTLFSGPPSLVELRSSTGAGKFLIILKHISERNTSSSANNLPPGWEERKNEIGLVYYVDHNTQTTSWIRPKSSGAGGAGEYHGSKMGLYQLLPDGAEKGDGQGPVYRQRHNGDNERYYLYRWDISCMVQA